MDSSNCGDRIIHDLLYINKKPRKASIVVFVQAWRLRIRIQWNRFQFVVQKLSIINVHLWRQEKMDSSTHEEITFSPSSPFVLFQFPRSWFSHRLLKMLHSQHIKSYTWGTDFSILWMLILLTCLLSAVSPTIFPLGSSKSFMGTNCMKIVFTLGLEREQWEGHLPCTWLTQVQF